MAEARLSDLQQAFALAHKAADSDSSSLADRNQYRAIAHLIWKALGRPSDEPDTSKGRLKYLRQKYDGWDSQRLRAQEKFTRSMAVQMVEAADEQKQLAEILEASGG